MSGPCRRGQLPGTGTCEAGAHLPGTPLPTSSSFDVFLFLFLLHQNPSEAVSSQAQTHVPWARSWPCEVGCCDNLQAAGAPFRLLHAAPFPSPSSGSHQVPVPSLMSRSRLEDALAVYGSGDDAKERRDQQDGEELLFFVASIAHPYLLQDFGTLFFWSLCCVPQFGSDRGCLPVLHERLTTARHRKRRGRRRWLSGPFVNTDCLFKQSQSFVCSILTRKLASKRKPASMSTRSPSIPDLTGQRMLATSHTVAFGMYGRDSSEELKACHCMSRARPDSEVPNALTRASKRRSDLRISVRKSRRTFTRP